MMQYLLIAWIVMCVCCIFMQYLRDVSTGGTDAIVNGEETKTYLGTWCVASSCVSISLIVLPILLLSVLSEKNLEARSRFGYYDPTLMGNNYSPPAGNYSPLASTPPR